MTDFNNDLNKISQGFLFWQVTNLWQREIKKALKGYHLTHSQFIILASIFTLKTENINQITIAHYTKIDPMTISTVLRNLQKKGLVQRHEHSIDTRAKSVQLTTNGRNIIILAIKTVEIFENEFFKPLGNKQELLQKNLLSILYKE